LTIEEKLPYAAREKIEKLDKSGNWFKIKLGSGDTGWVFKDLVKEAE
jgi:uncharacterized protein YgiM (DUF1202 family)